MPAEDDPFLLLQSENAVDRLRGARALLGKASGDDYAKLQELRAREVDSWVKVTLERVIQTTTRSRATFGDSDGWAPPESSQLTDDIRAEAIQYVSSVMLHELRPLVGVVFRATRELNEERFEESAAHRAISRLQEFLATMHRLHDAAAPPEVVQFDLVQLLNGEVEAGGYTAEQVVVSRTDTLIVVGDPHLLRFAVQNCVRNAVEASLECPRPVVVACGSNQSDTWVAILDEGVGLPEDKDKLLEPGNSMKSKDTHFGMGLPIAQRAMKSFGGYVELTPREFGGTACELRWRSPRGEE